MKKILVGILILFAISILIFVWGPQVLTGTVRFFTADEQIEAWRKEHRRLDNLFPREAENEEKRMGIIAKLKRRGIDIDPGLRDEAIEHHPTVRNRIIMHLWVWEDALGL